MFRHTEVDLSYSICVVVRDQKKKTQNAIASKLVFFVFMFSHMDNFPPSGDFTSFLCFLLNDTNPYKHTLN